MITRPTRVWEISDGCAYLLLHMAAERKVDDTEIVRMMELAVESTRHEEYVEHESLKATILKVFNKVVETRDKKELSGRGRRSWGRSRGPKATGATEGEARGAGGCKIHHCVRTS